MLRVNSGLCEGTEECEAECHTRRTGGGASRDYWCCFLGRQLTRLLVYRAMQRRLAGTNPNCAVWTPMTQTTALLTAATTQPCQSFWPMSKGARTVKMQET